jgi:hypothetical protein
MQEYRAVAVKAGFSHKAKWEWALTKRGSEEDKNSDDEWLTETATGHA